jgi:hypothetical protein
MFKLEEAKKSYGKFIFVIYKKIKTSSRNIPFTKKLRVYSAKNNYLRYSVSMRIF